MDNSALDSLMLGIMIEALENGTRAEVRIIRSAFAVIPVVQHVPIHHDFSEPFRGFNVGLHERMRMKFMRLRVHRTFFRAIRRELMDSMPQIYLNANGTQLVLPTDIADEEDLTASDVARVNTVKINHGLYHSIVFYFSTGQKRKPFLTVNVNINTDVYTTLSN